MDLIWFRQNFLYFSLISMDNTPIINTLETSNKVSALIDALTIACVELIDVFTMTFDKVTAYGIKSVQGVFVGVKSLFVDVIVMKLNQVAILIRELKIMWEIEWFQPAYIDSLIDLQRSQMMIKIDRHNFFKENFGRRVNEIFS